MAEIIEVLSQQEEQQQALNDIFEAIGSFTEDSDGMEMAGALLALEDDKFIEISPLILQQTKKSFTDPQTAIMFVSALNNDNVKYEDIVGSYEDLRKSIDELNTDLFTPVKKDFLKEILAIIVNSISDTQLLSKRIISIPIELIDENAKTPTYSNVGDAGADLYALESYTINPGEQVMIRTGIKVAIPYGYAILIQPRSGLSSKTKLRICNTPGLIDSGYRGEICVLMENVDPPIKDMIIDDEGKATGILYGSSHTIEAGDRIAQMRLVEVPTMAFTQVSTINDYESERGEGGFGSTGTK